MVTECENGSRLIVTRVAGSMTMVTTSLCRHHVVTCDSSIDLSDLPGTGDEVMRFN